MKRGGPSRTFDACGTRDACRARHACRVWPALLLALTGACSAVLGIEPGTLRDGGAEDTVGGGGASGGGMGGAAGACAISASASVSASACTRPSCAGMAGTECQGRDCCASSIVTSGNFTFGGSAGTAQATISTFALDDFEVTVGRFRNFARAYKGHPAEGAGAHPLISGSGWKSPTWDLSVPANRTELEAAVKCHATFQTWDESGKNDALPMNCVSWYDAFAFCAWDAGRLPTEAEWEYAAVGGIDQRLYAWGDSPEPDPSYAVYECFGHGLVGPSACTFPEMPPVGSKPKGVGKYGQLDLLGSMWEWGLDIVVSPFPAKCDNCARLTPPASGNMARTLRGHGWADAADKLSVIDRGFRDPTARHEDIGFRCARDVR